MKAPAAFLAVLACISVSWCKPQLVARWDFDQGEGDTLPDVTGNGHDGAIMGATWDEGKFGKCLYFDGVDDFVQVPADPGLDLTRAMTVEVWARLQEPGERMDRVLLSRADHPVGFGGWGFNWGYHEDFWHAQDGEYKRLGVAPIGEWVHVMLVCHLKGLRTVWYLNGRAMSSIFRGKPLTASQFPLYIGRRGQGHWFKGWIDEVSIYSDALSPEQVKARYARAPMPASGAEDVPPQGERMPDGSLELLGAWDKPIPAVATPFAHSNRYLALRNASREPLTIVHTWVNGRDTRQPEVTIGDSLGFFVFSGTDPATIPAGKVGVLNLKYMGTDPLPQKLDLTLQAQDGRIVSTSAGFAPQPLSFDSIACDEGLDGAWVYLSGASGKLEKVTLEAEGTAVRGFTTAADFEGPGPVPVRVDFSRPLAPGTPLLVRADTSAGPSYAFLRAYPAQFPIGMYRVQRQSVSEDWQPSEGREWLADYRDTFAIRGKSSGQAPDEWLIDCRKHFIDTLVPDYVRQGGDPARAGRFGLRVIPYGAHVERHANSPDISAWYSADEPRDGLTVEHFQGVCEQIRGTDPTRPVVVTINPPVFPRGVNFDLIDIGYQDTYPVPTRELENITRNVDLYRRLIAPKPVVFIPQTFRRGPGYTGGWSRFPTPDEGVYMVLLSLAAGARGEVYFAYNVEPGEPIEGFGVSKAPQAKALWDAVGTLNLQLATLAPLLARSCVATTWREGTLQATGLLAGDDTLVMVILNHDHEYTEQTFEAHAKADVRVPLALPSWLGDATAFRVSAGGLTDCEVAQGQVRVGDISAGALVVVTVDSTLRQKLADRRERLIDEVKALGQ